MPLPVSYGAIFIRLPVDRSVLTRASLDYTNTTDLVRLYNVLEYVNMNKTLERPHWFFDCQVGIRVDLACILVPY